jgi:hypothetical protein
MSVKRNWTIAYRMSKYANHYRRVTNWTGTWSEARLMAAEFESHNPGADVWYVPSREHEIQEAARIESGESVDYGQSDDWGNILMADGKRRISMRETGEVTSDMIESVKFQSWQEDQREAMNRAMTEDAITEHVKANPDAPEMTLGTDDMNNVGRYADLRGDTVPGSRGWLVVGRVKVTERPYAYYYALVWRGDANRPDTSRIVHGSSLTNLY